MMKSKQTQFLLFGALAAGVALSASTAPAWSQAKIYLVADCSVPHSASERQECAIQRSEQQQYIDQQWNSAQPSELHDPRPVMSPDNGGGGTQSPVVPNTTGAPITTGAPTWD